MAGSFQRKREEAAFSQHQRCPEWLDLFLRAARSSALDGWYFRPEPCWSCGWSGVVTAIDLYPIAQVFGAELCLGCRALRVSFCDRAPGSLDWADFKQQIEDEDELWFVERDGDEGWDSISGAVLALRRAVSEAEQAEHRGWRQAPRHLAPVGTNPSPTAGTGR